jgi:hypothetical protein
LKEEIPHILKVLKEDRKYNECIKEFAKDVNVSYPPKYQIIFGVSRVLFDNKTGPYAKVAENTKCNDVEYWYSTINGEVQEKFTVVYYHYLNIKNLETVTMNHCKRIIERLKQLNLDRPTTVGFNFRKFGCEYEAFILQLRSCFEHFIHSIAYYFNFKTTKPERLMNKLNELAGKDQTASRILKKFEEGLPSLKVIVSKSRQFPAGYSDRDKIAHVGQILLNPLNIIFNPSGKVTILPVGKYDGSKAFTNHPNLSESIEPLMFALFDLIFESYGLIFEVRKKSSF